MSIVDSTWPMWCSPTKWRICWRRRAILCRGYISLRYHSIYVFRMTMGAVPTIAMRRIKDSEELLMRLRDIINVWLKDVRSHMGLKVLSISTINLSIRKFMSHFPVFNKLVISRLQLELQISVSLKPPFHYAQLNLEGWIVRTKAKTSLIPSEERLKMTLWQRNPDIPNNPIEFTTSNIKNTNQGN